MPTVHLISGFEISSQYAFAEDNYFDKPRRTSTPLRFIDIRPFMRQYQMLDTGGT